MVPKLLNGKSVELDQDHAIPGVVDELCHKFLHSESGALGVRAVGNFEDSIGIWLMWHGSEPAFHGLDLR